MRKTIFAAALLLAFSASAADKYNFEPGHSQIRFGWNHLGYSNMTAGFDSFSGEVQLDTADLTKSSVSVTIPLSALDTGVAKLDEHLKGPDFFDAGKFPEATFKSTKVVKAGDKALKVHGDLTIHGVTKPVVLDVAINNIGEHPMAKMPAAGFDASVTVKRSDFGMGAYTPAVSDDVHIKISTELLKAQ